MKIILVSLAAALAVMAQTAAPKRTPAAAQKKPAAAAGPNKALMNPAALKQKAPDLYTAKFTTTKGDFVVEVHRDWAPNGADRFYNLVKNGYFDGASFFRVISGFMAQFGISAYPQVNKVWDRATIKDDPPKQTNARGTVSFAATSAPNSRSTQLFINLVDNARLDPSGFAPIGKVTEGMDVVDKLYSGYGDSASSGGTGPEQGPLQEQGKAYLDKNFPRLDSIVTARIIGPAAPAGAPKPSPTGAKKPPAPKPADKK